MEIFFLKKCKKIFGKKMSKMSKKKIFFSTGDPAALDGSGPRMLLVEDPSRNRLAWTAYLAINPTMFFVKSNSVNIYIYINVMGIYIYGLPGYLIFTMHFLNIRPTKIYHVYIYVKSLLHEHLKNTWWRLNILQTHR